MSKGKRIRLRHEQEKLVQKYRDLIKHAQLTKKEKFMVEAYKITMRFRVKDICDRLYEFKLSKMSKYFRKTAYEQYALAKVLGDYGDFHLIMLTRCAMKNTNWKDYYNEKGELIVGADIF